MNEQSISSDELNSIMDRLEDKKIIVFRDSFLGYWYWKDLNKQPKTRTTMFDCDKSDMRTMFNTYFEALTDAVKNNIKI